MHLYAPLCFSPPPPPPIYPHTGRENEVLSTPGISPGHHTGLQLSPSEARSQCTCRASNVFHLPPGKAGSLGKGFPTRLFTAACGCVNKLKRTRGPSVRNQVLQEISLLTGQVLARSSGTPPEGRLLLLLGPLHKGRLQLHSAPQ